jgi:hypothetical protein
VEEEEQAGEEEDDYEEQVDWCVLKCQGSFSSMSHLNKLELFHIPMLGISID